MLSPILLLLVILPSFLFSYLLFLHVMGDPPKENTIEGENVEDLIGSNFLAVEFSFLGGRVGEFNQVTCGELSIGSFHPSLSGNHFVTLLHRWFSHDERRRW